MPLSAPATPPLLRLVPGGHSESRARRLRSPLLVAVWVLLAFEALGGLVIFAVRLAAGSLPGEAAHVVVGVAFTLAWLVYQVRHWTRVRFRRTFDHAMGWIATVSLAVTNGTGLALGWAWWRAHGGAARYATTLSTAHLVGTLLALGFVGAHLGAVLLRGPALAPARPVRRRT